MEKKYEFIDESININGHELYRIRALKDFNGVKKGEYGGFIENENNLSHDGDCWVDIYANVYDNAKVFGNACIYENSSVFGNAEIQGNASIMGNSVINGNVYISGDVSVYSSTITDNVKIFNSCVIDHAYVGGDVQLFESTCIGECGHVTDNKDYLTVSLMLDDILNIVCFYRDVDRCLLMSCIEISSEYVDTVIAEEIDKLDLSDEDKKRLKLTAEYAKEVMSISE